MTITTKDLVKEVKKIASENPDFIYAGKYCSYFGQEVGDPTGQCCIIGQAFKNLNIDTSGIKEGGKITSPNIYIIIHRGMVDIQIDSDSDVIWLAKVQSVQDRKDPWGEAVDRANNYMEWPNA